MGEVAFIGLGLYDEKDISLRGLEEAKKADVVFAEFYTSLMPGLSLQKLEELIGRRISVVSRQTLERKRMENPFYRKRKKEKSLF